MREELRTTNISAPEANPESRGFALHCGGFINKPVSCQRGEEEGVATKHRSAAGSFVDVHSRFWITLVHWFLTIGIQILIYIQHMKSQRLCKGDAKLYC